ncbi:hypothetical protein [Haloechinothrix sp. LS1_15]|uniref:hypothetical protein n=1 Tax=Haloechinothrix sp. LS1_15 TaxID=2652248 RepID=UPI0029458530|nr:hypothetical protein [Haloechinothrix sp. LS1_15]MDV6014260.1 hypothetical protein [Haloechinothrix sp. LS1_15]
MYPVEANEQDDLDEPFVVGPSTPFQDILLMLHATDIDSARLVDGSGNPLGRVYREAATRISAPAGSVSTDQRLDAGIHGFRPAAFGM